MDIKDSLLNRYKPRASSINTRPSSIASYERSQNIHNTSDEHTQKSIQLKQGQQIKGEIVDLRSNSVTISIAEGKQILTAKLANDLPLAIGQHATFLVSEDSQDQITLKYMPPTHSSMEMQTADKALTAANLPKNDRNRMIVTELIKHNMPVDKQSLTQILRLILSNPSADPLTIILMQKHQIPVTSENITQFLAHQQGISSLSVELNTFTNQIFDLLNQSHTSESQKLSIHQELLSMASIGSNTTPVALNEIPLQNMLSENGVSQVNTLLAKQIHQHIGSIPQELKPAIQQLATGNLSVSATLQLIEQLYKDYSSITEDSTNTNLANVPASMINEQSNNPGSPLASISQPHFSQEGTQTKLLDTTPTILSNLWNKYGKPNETVTRPQQILSMDEISSLRELTAPLLSHEGNALINQEDISTNQLIDLFQRELPGKSNSLLLPLLQSPEYQKIIKGELQQKWTLTPEQFDMGNDISDYYQNLEEDVAHLRDMLEHSSLERDLSSVKDAANDVKDNLQFVKHLNDMFTYLPLPLSFRDQGGHGELYVFTQKKNLSPENKNISVMLHLTMEHLGDINVFLQMDHNHVASKFYIEDKEAYSLVKDHISILSNQLELRGYTFTGEVNSAYQPLDFTKEFIDTSGEDVNLSRYNFDIRA